MRPRKLCRELPSPRFPAPLSPDTASTSRGQASPAASQARSRPVKGFGLPRHHARNHKGADCHGQTLSPPTPSNRPSVAVYLAPLICRLLQIHYHNPISSLSSINIPPAVPNTANMSDKVAAPTPSNPLPASTQPQAQAQNAPLGSPAGQAIAAQQSDNVAHALAGAGGGLLSMALTWVPIVETSRTGHHAEAITVIL